MAEESVGVKITGTNASTAAFNSVKSGIEGLENATKKLRDTFGDLGRLLSAGAAFAGFKAFINEANEAEGIANRFAAVFGDIADEANKSAKIIASSFGLSNDESQKQLTNFSLILTNLGYTKTAALGMSDSMVRLANDMASFAHVPVGDATRAIEMGLMGATKGLREFGIVISETQIKEEALRIGLGNTKGELSAVEKAFIVHNLLLKNATSVTGDFARNQDSYNNQLKKFQTMVSEAGEKIGRGFLPKISEILQAFTRMPPVVQQIVIALIPLGAALTALGLKMTAVTLGISTILYIGAKYLNHLEQENEETIKFIENCQDEGKVLGIVASLKQKAHDATIKHEQAVKALGETGNIVSAEQAKAALNEEMRLKGLLKFAEDRVKAFEKERKAVLDEAMAEAEADAKIAQAKEQGKLDEEQRLKDLKEARKKAKEDAIQHEKDVAEFVKELRIEVVTTGIKQERAKLDQWYKDKLELVKGNSEAENLLNTEYTQRKKELYDEEYKLFVEKCDKEAEKEKATQKLKQDYIKNSVTSFAANMNIIAGEFKEAFGLAKAATIAEATMKGYEAVLNAYTWATSWGGPIAGAIAGGIAAIAAGIQIANIAATPPPFQTASEQVRTISGPSSRETIIRAHGGEKVGRNEAVNIAIYVSGDIYNADETIPRIAEGLRYYTKQTGFQLSGAV